MKIKLLEGNTIISSNKVFITLDNGNKVTITNDSIEIFNKNNEILKTIPLS